MRPATHILRGLILLYRGLLSPVTPASCRFIPTCSGYALEAVTRYGAWRGGLLAARRLLRCHPWGGCGVDPVPDLPPLNPQHGPARPPAR